MKFIMKLTCLTLYTIGDLVACLLLRYEWMTSLYGMYSWCMKKSLNINEKYDLDVWQKP